MSAPPMAYFGGKTMLGPRIAKLLPPHQHYVEPFAGSLAVLLAKKPSRMETVNDLDGQLMTFWQVLRDKPSELARVCMLTPHSRAEHQNAKAADLEDLDDVEIARLVWVRITQGRAGTLRKTGWRYYIDPAGSSIGMPGYLSGYVDRMADAAQRLHHVSLECGSGIELCDRYARGSDICLYVDPPYLGITRSSGSYQTEMADPESHAELLEALLRARSSVVLSGYSSDLYNEALKDWSRLEIPTMTGQGGSNQERTEVIWSNRDLPHAPMHLNFEEYA